MPKARTTAAFAAGCSITAAAALLMGAGHAERAAAIEIASQPAGETNRTSYAIGHDLGAATLERLAYDRVTHNKPDLLKGFTDALNGTEPRFTAAEMAASLAVLERKVAHTIATDRLATDPVFKALALDNLEKSEAFMTKFASGDETKSLEGDLYYRVRESGEGPSPKATDTVIVDFQARLIDGTLIGAESGFSARVDGMIPGVQIFMQAMKPGDRWITLIPPQQAFGIGGRFPDVGPNQAVIAEVTLREIKQ